MVKVLIVKLLAFLAQAMNNQNSNNPADRTKAKNH